MVLRFVLDLLKKEIIKVPYRTYISIPGFLASKLSIKLEWKDENGMIIIIYLKKLLMLLFCEKKKVI